MAAAPPVVDTANVAGATALPEAAKQQESKAVATPEQAKDAVTEHSKEQNQSQVSISKADMRKLVQSARVELSNSK